MRSAGCMHSACIGGNIPGASRLVAYGGVEEGNQCVTGTRSWSPSNRMLGRGDN